MIAWQSVMKIYNLWLQSHRVESVCIGYPWWQGDNGINTQNCILVSESEKQNRRGDEGIWMHCQHCLTFIGKVVGCKSTGFIALLISLWENVAMYVLELWISYYKQKATKNEWLDIRMGHCLNEVERLSKNSLSSQSRELRPQGPNTTKWKSQNCS